MSFSRDPSADLSRCSCEYPRHVIKSSALTIRNAGRAIDPSQLPGFAGHLLGVMVSVASSVIVLKERLDVPSDYSFISLLWGLFSGDPTGISHSGQFIMAQLVSAVCAHMPNTYSLARVPKTPLSDRNGASDGLSQQTNLACRRPRWGNLDNMTSFESGRAGISSRRSVRTACGHPNDTDLVGSFVTCNTPVIPA